MRKNINLISIQPGWTKGIESNQLVIKKDQPFDIMEFMDTPFFAAYIHVQPDQSLEVELNDFAGYHTDGIALQDVIVSPPVTIDDIVF